MKSWLAKVISGNLKDKSVLSKEIDRKLASPKAENFPKLFCNQWLGTDAVETGYGA